MGLAPVSSGIRHPVVAPASKLTRAAREFEALLLNDLLGPVEKSFSSIPGQETAAGSGSYQYFATQALASSLAASGGLGIADRIVRNLLKVHGLKAAGEGLPAAKVPFHEGR